MFSFNHYICNTEKHRTMKEFQDLNEQGHTFKDRKEALKYCYYSVCAVIVILMVCRIGEILNKIILTFNN